MGHAEPAAADPPYPTGPPEGVDRSPEWESDRLDLGAYLARCGYHGPVAPTTEALRLLHRAHMSTFTFENVDIALGRPVSLALDDVARKLVGAGRGGYCYETNLLFAAALDRFGFAVTRLLSRIREGSGRRRFRSHTSLLVRARDEPGTVWLADPGYGYAGLIEPLPLREGATQDIAGWRWRLGRDDGHWVLRMASDDGWFDLYAFRPEPQYAVDFLAAHHVSSTRPGSPFVGRLVAQRGGETARHRLRDTVLTTDRPGGRTETVELSPAGTVEALRSVFGLRLSERDAGELCAFLDTPERAGGAARAGASRAGASRG
ncbi:arylamine N-acetyltransferase [Streptomyces sp. NPDC004610]|uniref:arylamine N-acetyltransferase family protein n=1 Tax=unclassified Streptomyces TaxID=2593676 RepID=UPI0033A8AB05